MHFTSHHAHFGVTLTVLFREKSMRVLIVALAMAAMPAASQTPAQSAWKTFTNRAGWSIQYPAKWKVGSCNNCSDPAAGDVFVTFSDPARPTDRVMIDHLIPKPADKSTSQWLQEMS